MLATGEALETGLEHVRAAPTDEGVLELIARRPAVGEREVLDEAQLDTTEGLVGDSWSRRGTRPNPKSQLTLQNARAAALVAGERDRWALAGDQLYVDLDLSGSNLPPGTRLAIGEAIVEVSDMPHLGCHKFTERFGQEARDLVNSPGGVALNLRGVNTMVVQSGIVRRGDAVRKLSSD
jgi:MOSC domain-containing protein YiiM